MPSKIIFPAEIPISLLANFFAKSTWWRLTTAVIDFSQEVETGYGISHGPLLQKVIDSLEVGDIAPPVSAKDAILTARVVHALYRSDELQAWVKLDDKPISHRLGKKGV